VGECVVRAGVGSKEHWLSQSCEPLAGRTPSDCWAARGGQPPPALVHTRIEWFINGLLLFEYLSINQITRHLR